MSILPFRQRHAEGSVGLPVVRPEREPMAFTRSLAPDAEFSEDPDKEQNWGVAVALATWPLCLGASAIYVVL